MDYSFPKPALLRLGHLYKPTLCDRMDQSKMDPAGVMIRFSARRWRNLCSWRLKGYLRLNSFACEECEECEEDSPFWGTGLLQKEKKRKEVLICWVCGGPQQLSAPGATSASASATPSTSTATSILVPPSCSCGGWRTPSHSCSRGGLCTPACSCLRRG